MSFTKGCYVGQETVARLYYRGKPNRQLRGLRLRRSGRPAPRSPSNDARGRAAGQRRRLPALGRIGLALVRREAPPGSRVAVGPTQVEADVVELPFAAELTVRRRARGESSGEPSRSGAGSQRQLRRLRDARRARCRGSGPRRPRRAARGRPARRRGPPRASAAPSGPELDRARRLSGPQSASRPRRSRTRPSAARWGARRAPAAGGHGWPRAPRRAARGSPAAAGRDGAASRALVRWPRRRLAHLRLDVGDQRLARAVAPARRTGAAPRRGGGGTGSDRGRPGTATGNGPSGRRRTGVAARQPPAAVTQPEQRVELLDELDARRRPRSGPIVTACPAAGSGPTSRIGNGMSSRQRMYTSRSSRARAACCRAAAAP